MNKFFLSLVMILSSQPILSQNPSPTMSDVRNLAQVTSGAREKINPEIPKDKYGRPAYRIGNLGGVPVHLPQGVDYLEYSDSPGWNPEAIKNYNPDMRTYDSVIESFGFEFRSTDLTIYDSRDDELYDVKQYDNKYKNGGDWIKASVLGGKAYGGVVEALTDTLESATNGFYLEPPYPVPHRHYERLEKEDKYGLESFINPGIDPDTNKPWREYEYAEDLFVARDEKGLVKTYITCSNRKNIPYPGCDHLIRFPYHMKIRLQIRYHRKNLKDWKELENNAIKIIESFQVK